MRALARAFDWSRTPLGPVESWPQSLRTAASIVSESKFAMMLAWGDDLTQIYNDEFRPILGRTKHPSALGQGVRETFSEAWHIISPLFDQVMGGEAVRFDDMLVPLDRFGYLEECYFAYSYSPIRDESDNVAGVFVTVAETTMSVVAERRLVTLRELAFEGVSATSEADAWQRTADALALASTDLPFALLYVPDDEDKANAKLVRPSKRGSSPFHVATSPLVGAGETAPPSTWPLRRGSPQLVADVRERFGQHPGPVWPEPVEQALILPIARAGIEPYGYLVAGISPRRALDTKYRDFLGLVADQIATSIANARTIEEEKKRAEALALLDRQKTAFFTNVSHELRTPLTLLLGPLTTAIEAAEKTAELPPEMRQALDMALRNARRLQRLVNGLLDFTRIEAGRLDALYEPTDLASFTAQLADVFRSAYEGAGLTLSVETSIQDAEAFVDHAMWEKIVFNLLSNAFKHTFEGGVTVSVRDGQAEHAGTIELVVRDTGVGIPEAEIPRLFDRFHRVAGTRSRTQEGTGIGLSFVRELVRVHGGTIAIESREGEGTTVCVRVPRGSAHLPAESVGVKGAASKPRIAPDVHAWLPTLSASPNTPKPSSSASERGRVLVADDNADLREHIARILSPQFEVEAVGNGVAALHAVRQGSFDVVVSDVMMPELDGIGLVRAVRSDAKIAATPIILVSARAGDEATESGLASGADDYLVKPFSARELLARVTTHAALGRARHAERAARERAEEASRAKDEFLSVLSHELRTPLNAVVGWASLLRSNGVAESQRAKALETIERNARAQAKLIDDLLDLSRIAQGKLVLTVGQVEMNRVVEAALDSVRLAADAKGVQLQPELDAKATLVGDADRLQQVVWNLLSNAIKFTPRGGVVKVRLERSESSVELAISDTGQGIDPAFLPYVFDRFRQADSSFNRRAGGLGLGLAIVRSLVELHGGTVDARSEGAGRGATLTVRLPFENTDKTAPLDSGFVPV